jgi:hypothetical protein
MSPADVLRRRAELAEAQRRALLAATEAGTALHRLDEDEGIYDADALHAGIAAAGYAGNVATLERDVRSVLGGGDPHTPGPWTRGEVERALTVMWPRGVAKVLDGCDAVIRAREETER